MNTLALTRVGGHGFSRGLMIPMADVSTGFLPLGRYSSSLVEVEAQFVADTKWTTSATRAAIWEEFISATEQLRSVLPVCSVWISGSFLTQKLNPDDIDVLYWCENRHISAIPSTRVVDRLMLQKFARNELRSDLGLRIDSRVGEWHARPEPAFLNTPEDRAHIIARGFWDDFWQRARSGAKGAPAVRADAIPRRGYIEVMLDGHDEH